MRYRGQRCGRGVAVVLLFGFVGLFGVASGAVASAQPDPSPAAGEAPLLTPEPAPSRSAESDAGRVPEPADRPQSVPSSTSGWSVTGYVALGIASVGLSIVALTTLWWMLHAWRSEQSLAATRFSRRPVPPRLSFTLIVPARHEEGVLGQTLDGLARLDHPMVEIIVVVGEDDPGTAAVARQAAERHADRVRVLVDDSCPKNKPKALNLALAHARGEIVGVIDAEDEVHPRLLRLVDDRFSMTGADIVQGGVQLMNHDTTWWSLRNVLEYFFWFRSRMHFHARQRFIPLGGNTVFFRTDLVHEAGGWDAGCLAEDCEIGVRLSCAGASVVVAYDAEVATREETPASLGSLFKQRTRWNQGFLQVLRKREWRRLPTRRQRVLARYLLAMPFLQAFTGVLIPVSVLLILFAKVPTAVAMLTFLPVAPTVVTVCVEVAGLGEFGVLYGRKVRARDYVRLVVGTIPYQVFLATAAVRAVARELRGDHSWEKTAHSGLHRPDERDDATDVAAPTVARRTGDASTGAGAGG